jgi:hypothetical protein
MDLFVSPHVRVWAGENARRRETGRRRDTIIFTAWHYYICVHHTTIYVSAYYCAVILLYRVWARGNATRRGTGWQSEERRIDWPFKTKAVNSGSPVSNSGLCTSCTVKYTSCTSKVQVLHTSKVPLWSMWSSVKFVKWPNSSGRFFRSFWSNQIRCNFCNSPISCLQHM